MSAVTQTFKPDVYPRVDDEATIVVTWPAAVGIIQASWNWPFDRKDLEVYGATGQALTVKKDAVRFRLEGKDEAEVPSPPLDAPEDDPVRYLAAVARGEVAPLGTLVAGEQPDRHRDPRRRARVRAHRADGHPAGGTLGGGHSAR